MTKRPEMLLWLSDSRGIYIPRDFAKSFSDRAKTVQGVSDEDWATLELGPHYQSETDSHTVFNDVYWEVWDDICTNAVITDEHGHKYRIYQDGDCWLIPEGMEWNEETDSFDWPDERMDNYDIHAEENAERKFGA